MVLVGVHPTLTQVPPTYSRSTTAVRRPAPPRARASGFPAWPVPRTIASKRSGSMIMPRQERRVAGLPRYLPAGTCFHCMRESLGTNPVGDRDVKRVAGKDDLSRLVTGSSAVLLRASVGSTEASASLLARVGVVGPTRA